MRLHETWTGAANPGDRTFSVASVEGVAFTAYASGCNIVILSSSFERVQIIPGVCHDNIQISCLDCSVDSGRIAAAYANEIIIFEPTPILTSKEINNSRGNRSKKSNGLDYWWVETARIKAECPITTLAWSNEGNRIITAGDYLQLWQYEIQNEDAGIQGIIITPVNDRGEDTSSQEIGVWKCTWKVRPANPVHYLAYSPDGTLFATCGKSDRLVRIWYENQQLLLPGQIPDSIRSGIVGKSFDVSAKEISFGYIYVAHPRSVTALSWRKTSKYMPKGNVANVLVTSCTDNICRLWCETVLPDTAEGIPVSMHQLDPNASQDIKFRTHRQRAKFLQRFRHVRQSFTARKFSKEASSNIPLKPEPIGLLPSTYSVHEFHNYGYQGSGVSPGLHFHLAGTLNAATDIPLVPSMATPSTVNMTENDGAKEGKTGHHFVLHWMNNKEMEFTIQAEKIMEDLLKTPWFKDDSFPGNFESESGQNASVAGDVTIESSPRLVTKGSKTNVIKEPGGTLKHIESNASLGTGKSGDQISVSSRQSDTGRLSAQLADILDRRIEKITKEWHQNSDLLFSIHPIDGSLLVWVADFLDEYQPGAYRQAQVSFSSRIPNAIPLGDAMTIAANINVYNSDSTNFKELFRSIAEQGSKDSTKDNENKIEDDEEKIAEDESKEHDEEEEDEDVDAEKEKLDKKECESSPTRLTGKGMNKNLRYKPAPMVSFITKHTNGTLNLWSVMFADKSKFCSLLNINHCARASGHRFRVNDMTCHPVLPLLLTTSHHNIVRMTDDVDLGINHEDFCSELILWRVDPVGPLSKSGGITELARVNSKEISAFTDVTWLPTLLPSTILGPVSNSPSACFVASDGHSLRVYQAVIDARTLLSEMNSAMALKLASSNKKNIMEDSMMSMSSEDGSSHLAHLAHATKLHDKFRIVSTQSTARPGAVIELQPIEDATQDWQNTMLLHAFQEQLIVSHGNLPSQRSCSSKSKDGGSKGAGLIPASMSAMVDLQSLQGVGGSFCEPFYVVLVEKKSEKSGGAFNFYMHMWKITLCIEGKNIPDDPDDSSGTVTPEQNENDRIDASMSEIHVNTKKVCCQKLPLPPDVEIVDCVAAAGHLSSASIFPACLAPYLLITACTDNTVRFWRTKVIHTPIIQNSETHNEFEWEEWRMESADGTSSIQIPGRPLSVSAAYTGRIAIAYQSGKFYEKSPGNRGTSKTDEKSMYVNLCTAIYECESSGGSEWILEDTIYLKNIELHPQIPRMDMSAYDEGSIRKRDPMVKFAQHFEETSGLSSVPSMSTLEGVKRYINKMGNAPSTASPKRIVMLDWVSNEDGSHILTVTVGNKVLLLTAVSNDISQANVKAVIDARNDPRNRPLLRQSSSMAFQNFSDEVRWMQIRRIAIKTVDGLSPMPVSSGWVRDGLFVIGMDSEFAVYSQWKPASQDESPEDATENQKNEVDTVDNRHLQDSDLLNIAQDTNLRKIKSHENFSNISTAGGGTKPLADLEKRKKGIVTQEEAQKEMNLLPDFGLFEASHMACPVLPQYHPKQLMELLNSGKIRWVKAILAHLVRCIGGGSGGSRYKTSTMGSFNDDPDKRSPRHWSKSRTLSVSQHTEGGLSPGGSDAKRPSLSVLPEEVTLDYAEINSIPPLPLWTLLAADKDDQSKGGGGRSTKDVANEYDDLFQIGVEDVDENLDNLLEMDDDDDMRAKRKSTSSMSAEKHSFSYFGPRQARMLSNLLTHTHLPGLTSLDQMHLLALADTVSTCQLDLAERFAIDAAKNALSKESSGVGAKTEGNEPSAESLDDCGLRFLLAMKHFTYLQKCLPMKQRAQLQKQGLGTDNIIWAFHSDSEELLEMIPSVNKGTPTWTELSTLGVGWWITNNGTLKRLIEKVAKAAFQKSQDPLDAAVFYLAMKKKSLVWGLYRSIKDERMTVFFKNNFSEERWRKAALKNAYALLGKQRYLHAAAFFLLSGSLKDAIDICIDKLHDLQLAMVIARLYDGEVTPTPNSLISLLNLHVLGCNSEGKEYNSGKAHPDPFLRSIAKWINRDYSGSLSTLVCPNMGYLHPEFNQDEALALKRKKLDADPSVFNFYIYLRTHPLITRHTLANKKAELVSAGGQGKGQTSAIMLSGFRGDSVEAASGLPLAEEAVTHLERRLYFSTAHFHLRAGCPALAVEVLSKLPNRVIDTPASAASSTAASSRKQSHSTVNSNVVTDARILETGIFDHSADLDFSQPVPTKKPTENEKEPPKRDESSLSFGGGGSIDILDWSQPLASPKVTEDEDQLQLDWSDDPESDEDTAGPQKSGMSNLVNTDIKYGTEGKIGAPLDDYVEKKQTSGYLDIMAQQLKFIGCLKIMMEELSTLATGFEVDGGLLRYQLYIWLEREVEALKQLCNYGATDSYLHSSDEDPDATQSSHLQSTMQDLFAKEGRRPTLHEVMLAEKADFEVKVKRAAKRKQWLIANQTLLRTLLSYCGLRGANGGGLASVRMELILLLQELQQENSSQKQLLSPLPFPTTLPLLSACIAQQKTVVADPIRHLQSLTHDMLVTINNRTNPPLPGLVNYGSVFTLRGMCIALSSCIYQSLSDSDSINLKKLVTADSAASAVLEALSRLSVVYQDSSLISTSASRKPSSSNVGGIGSGGDRCATTVEDITTEPAKWPGVTSLRALLDREKDEETPTLNVLLCEAYVAIYMSLLSYALATCDPLILYRLIGQKPNQQYWSSIFGGGSKTTLHVMTSHTPISKSPSGISETVSNAGVDSSIVGSLPSEETGNVQGLLKDTMTNVTKQTSNITNITKQRVKLNIKALGVQLAGTNQDTTGAQSRPEKQTFREQFTAPEMSIISKLMAKPLLDSRDLDIEVDSNADDSDDENEDEDDDIDDDPFSNVLPKDENVEHSNPHSFAWCLIRHACIVLAQQNLEKFLSMAGIEYSELPVASPLVYACMRMTETWKEYALESINNFGQAPDDFIPGCFSNPSASGPAIEKYRCLFEPENTPFRVSGGHGLKPIKRLWQFLVRQEPVQKYFVKFIFGRRYQVESGFGGLQALKAPSGNESSNVYEAQSYVSDTQCESDYPDAAYQQITRMHQPVKIIHKEHDAITSFCINKVSTGLMSMTTQKELQELNISLFLNPVSWDEGMNEEANFDVLALNEDQENMPSSNYLVVQTPGDPISHGSSSGGGNIHAPGVHGSSTAATSQLNSPSSGGQPTPFGPAGGQGSAQGHGGLSGGKGSAVVQKHKIEGIRRLAAHSHLPLYVSGSQDGSIRMWEWSHNQAVQNVRPAGVFAKVNRLRFTQQGNKFGVGDGDGNVVLWQAANASQSFFTHQCHSKQTSDFVFQGGSSSLFCTAGHSSDGKNVALWDTLMPHKRCLIQGFTFHEAGASSCLFATQHHQLITGGKKGLIGIWDMRHTQRQINFFKAHEHPIKCIAIDPNEEFIVTGAVDGDIKIWSLNNYKCQYTFTGEHSRHGIFKNISQGVSQVMVDEHNRLFSCGADGSMKVRQLPDRDIMFNNFTNNPE